MIFEMLFNLFYDLYDTIMVFEMPSLPDEAMGYLEQFYDILSSGATIVANYTHYPYLMTLLGIVLGVDLALGIYHLVMWIIRKIPMAGMS